MPGVIGNANSSGPNRLISGTTEAVLNVDDTGTYVTGDVVTEVAIQLGVSPGADSEIQFGLYAAASAGALTTGTLVWSRNITIPSGTAVGVFTQAVPSDAITATNGQVLGGAISTRVSGGSLNVRSGPSGDSRSLGGINTTLPGTWSETGTAVRNLTATVTTSVSGNTSEGVTGTLAYTGLAPQANATENRVSAGVAGTLAYTGIAGQFEATEDEANTSEGVVGTLAYTGLAPQAVTTENNISQGVTGTLTYTGLAGQFNATENNVSAGVAGTLTYTGVAGQFETTEGNVSAGVTGSLVLTGIAAQAVTTENNISAGVTGQLTYTGIAGQFEATEGEANISQGVVGQHVLTGIAAQVVTTENNVSAGVTGEIRYTGIAGEFATGDFNISQGVTGTLTYTGIAGQTITTENNVVQGVTGTLVLSGVAGTFVSEDGGEISQGATGTITYTGIAARVVTTETVDIIVPDITIPAIPNIPDTTPVDIGTTAAPIRRIDLENMRKIGINFRVISSLEQVVNDSIQTLTTLAENQSASNQPLIDAINASLTAITQSLNTIVSTLNTVNQNAAVADQRSAENLTSIQGLAPQLGMGNPEGVVESNESLMFFDTSGSTLYVNTTGPASLTGWVAV
jgi:uncharacterized protein YukE